MTSNVALRIAYFSLNLVGGLAMAIMILTLCLEIRRLRNGLFLASLALCASRIISVVVSSLLLFSGSMTGKTPPETLCIVQSGLHNAQTPFISYTVLAYVGIILLLISHSSISPARVIPFVKGTLLAVPFVVFITLTIISVAITTQQVNELTSPLFYCALDHKALKRASAILSGVALFATILVVLCIFYALSRKRNEEGSEYAWVEELSISLLLLGMYTAVRSGFWIANYIKETVASDMLDAVDGIVLFFIIATQGWSLSSWNGWLERLHCFGSEEPQAPSQTPVQVYHHSIRQVISVPSVIDIRSMQPIQEEEVQSPKLLALASAMGLAPLEPPVGMREIISPSPKLQVPDRRVYSVEPAYGSYASFKSMQYGVAFGHPSRDVSRDPTPAQLDGHSDDAREPSLVVLPPASDKSLYDDQNDPEPENTRPAVDVSHASQSPNTYLSPLFNMQTPMQMSSALASSRGDYLSMEQTRSHTNHSSYLPVSLESRSATPRSQNETRPSFENPLRSRNISTRTVDLSTEEGAHWSTSSESNPPILLDASASSLSWPNVSPPSSDLRHHRGRGSDVSRLGVYSPSLSAGHGHRASPSIDSSQYHAAHASTPSPLSLNEMSHMRPSVRPEPHPFARGISPFRPPGLHIHSYSDGA